MEKGGTYGSRKYYTVGLGARAEGPENKKTFWPAQSLLPGGSMTGEICAIFRKPKLLVLVFYGKL